jgi:uncharacterized protein YkwD
MSTAWWSRLFPPREPDLGLLTGKVSTVDLLEGHNHERRTHGGLAPLVTNPSLMIAARYQAAWQATIREMTHGGPRSAPNVQSRVQQAGYTGSVVSGNAVLENCGVQGPMIGDWSGLPDPRTAEWMIQSWMNSPLHRANILNVRASEVGFGVADSRGDGSLRYYCTVLGIPARPL